MQSTALIECPRASFPLKPTINSDHELNEALHEIGYLTSVQAARKAELSQRIEELTAEFQEKLNVAVQKEKKPVAIATHINNLNAAIEKYAEKHRDTIVEPGKKSRAFTSGEIGWREGKDRIDFCGGYSASKVEKVLEGASKVLNKLRKVLESVPFIKTRTLSLVCVPKISFSKTNTLKAYQAGDLKDEHLEAIGVVYVPGEESFYIKPNEVRLQSEAA